MIDLGVLLAVVIGLTELVKRVGKVNNKYLPLVSLLFGLIGGLVYIDGSIDQKALTGIILGLTASGLYDQKKIIEKED